MNKQFKTVYIAFYGYISSVKTDGSIESFKRFTSCSKFNSVQSGFIEYVIKHSNFVYDARMIQI